jgi:hypothetical protein
MHVEVNKCAVCTDSEIVAEEIDNLYHTSKQLIEFKDLHVMWYVYMYANTQDFVH